MKITSYFPLVCLLLLTSCATLITGTTDTINFDTEPYGATVYIDETKVLCESTPCFAEINRSGIDKKFAKIELENHKTETFEIRKKFNMFSVLNNISILNWGLDFGTGSYMRYDKIDYFVKLEKDKNASIKDTLKNNLIATDKITKTNPEKKKRNELGIKLSILTHFIGSNQLANLEYERTISKHSSIGISIGYNFWKDGNNYEEIDKPYQEELFFPSPVKFDLTVQPYYRYFFENHTKDASGLFIEGNLYFGYYPYQVRKYYYYNQYRTPYYKITQDNTSLKHAMNYGAGAALGRKFVMKNGFGITALFGLGIRKSTSQIDGFIRSGITISQRF